MIRSAAAPSLSGQEFPAVTEPPSLNPGFSLPSTSIVVPPRGPSSLLTIASSKATSLPSLSVSLCAGTLTGTISSSKCPLACPSAVGFWVVSAHSSCASRLTLQLSVTFSTVIPIGIRTSYNEPYQPSSLSS